jgi:benzoylformate decarboxylase
MNQPHNIAGSSQSRFTVRDATFELLRSLGMTTVFGNPGSTEIPFFKDWPEDLRYVMALQEASVVAMADGFAQASRNAAFVNLHSAAGLGHALGNIFTAYTNHTPLVITAGQQTRALLLGEPYLFARDATEFPRPYVKWSYQPALASDIPAAIARAYYIAMQKPCGPTFVSIPADDWEQPAQPVEKREVFYDFAPDPAALAKVAQALNDSRQPALVVGPDVDRDRGGWDLVVKLAERLGARVWVSPLSSRACFPEDHPLFAGFLPPVRQQLSQKLAAHDVVLVLGAPVFTYHVYSEGPVVPPQTKLFLITDNPDEAAYAQVGSSLQGTLRLALAGLLDLLKDSIPARNWPQRAWRPEAPSPDKPMSGEFVMHTISQVMPPEAIIVEEAPSHRGVMHDYLPIRQSGGFYTGASGGLGYGLPAAIGVALAEPTRRVICIVGDGSSMYSIQALWTAVQQRLPITFVVLNNQGYAALKSFNRMLSVKKGVSYELPGIDFVALARSLGCQARPVEDAGELAATLEDALKAPEPVLLEVQVSRDIASLY